LTLQIPSLRKTTCETCRTRECCSHFMITLTGEDVVRISQTLKIAPIQLAQATALPNADPQHGFVLKPGGAPLHLTLRKQKVRTKLKPCAFLLSLEGGRKLCGLGDLRPSQCQTFPVLQGGSLSDDEVAPRLYRGPGCWRTWHLGELDLIAESAALLQQRAAQRAYAVHVATWNERISQQHSAFEAKLEQFLAFIVNRYATPSPSTPKPSTQGA
jgi:Fe-S-cluster containining protein